MRSLQLSLRLALCLACVATFPVRATDIIVSAQDGKFVRVDGRATYPEPAPPDSLVVLDASRFPPVVTGTVEGLEHSVQGPPQAVAVTPDGRLAIVAAPTRYDYVAKKELLDNFLQVIDLEATPPKLIGKVDVGAHPNGLSINREGTLLLAAAHDGAVKVLAIEGKNLKLLDSVKVGEKRMSGIAFTHDGKAAIVALRDENGAAVLAVDGPKVTLTKERISTGVNPYAIDVSSDGQWAVIGNTGVGRTVDDADVVTLVDVSKRPFRAVQQISVPATPEGLAISPNGDVAVAIILAGSNNKNAYFHKRNGSVTVLGIEGKKVTKLGDVEVGGLPEGAVFTPDGKYLLVGNYLDQDISILKVDGTKVADTGKRFKLPGHPASMRIGSQ